jgi:hypothetical protein
MESQLASSSSHNSGHGKFYLKFNSERDKAAFLLFLYIRAQEKLPFSTEKAMQDAIVINLWISVEIAREMLFSPFDVVRGEECMRSLGSTTFGRKALKVTLRETTNLEQLPPRDKIHSRKKNPRNEA